MLHVDRGTQSEIKRWPLLLDREWQKLSDMAFIQSLRTAFQYVQGGRLAVMNCGAGLNAGLLARTFPTARITGCDLDRYAPGTDQMAAWNDLSNVDFMPYQERHDVGIENFFDSTLLLDVVTNRPEDGGLIGAAARSIRPGGRVIVVARETLRCPADGLLTDVELRQRLVEAGLTPVSQLRITDFDIHVGIKW